MTLADQLFTTKTVALVYTGTVLGTLLAASLSFMPFLVVAWLLEKIWISYYYSSRFFFLVYLGLIGYVFLNRQRKTRATVLAQPKAKKFESVTVIGGGVCGLVAAKELKDEGFSVRIFEKEGHLGGIWKMGSEGGRVYEDIISTSSAFITSFSDMLPREYNGKLKHPFHLTAEEYTTYVNKYADDNGLREITTFNQNVDHTRWVKHDGKDMWEIESVAEDGTKTKSYSDAIVFAGGTNQEPRYIYPPNHEAFKGVWHHSKVYKTPEMFTGKKVLIIGVGDSAGDMVMHIAKVAEHVHYSVGKGVICAPRMMHNTPIDYNNHFLLYCMPLPLRNLLRDTVVRKATYHTDPIYGKTVAELDAAAPKGYGERTRFIMKTGRFIDAVHDGKATIHYKIKTCTENGVIFEDGTEVEVDEIILCTGFERNAYVFRESFPDQQYKLDHERYLTVFDPTVPNCAFVGFIRPSGAGAVGPLAEMQSRLLAQVWAGKVDIGSDEEVISFSNRYRDWYDSVKTMTLNKQVVQWAQYLDEVACSFGAGPALTKLYFSDPMKWARLMLTPVTGHRYRLEGPHPCPSAFDEMVNGLTLIPDVAGKSPVVLVRKGTVFSAAWFLCTFWSGVTQQKQLAPAMYRNQFVY
mmetsp:Transcript_145553/g.206138  ORF Transcript_145553/g.206138 Transcript_145553/m.206138 type:complete len:633 (-) Transcript_145553:46-1944(-)